MSCDSTGNHCTGNSSTWGNLDVWLLGYDPERWGMRPDPKTLSTVIRDGNYDFRPIRRNGTTHLQVLLYLLRYILREKPLFFRNNPWPWVNPANGSLDVLPAKARFESGAYFCNSGC